MIPLLLPRGESKLSPLYSSLEHKFSFPPALFSRLASSRPFPFLLHLSNGVYQKKDLTPPLFPLTARSTPRSAWYAELLLKTLFFLDAHGSWLSLLRRMECLLPFFLQDDEFWSFRRPKPLPKTPSMVLRRTPPSTHPPPSGSVVCFFP